MLRDPDPTSEPEKAYPHSTLTGNRGKVMIARVMGMLCVAVGFLLGIHGLDHPGSLMLPTGLGMIATGLIAQVFALVKACFADSQGRSDD